MPNDDMALANEHPKHQVVVDRPFYMGIHEVTRQQYALFDAESMKRSSGSYATQSPETPVTDIRPVDALAFCVRFGMRLPTAPEWEYAARSNLTRRYPWGDCPDDGNGWANLLDISAPLRWKKLGSQFAFKFNDGLPGLSEVGTARHPNRFGLYDVCGNAAEICLEWKDGRVYDADPVMCTLQKWQQMTPRAVRGGSFSSGEVEARLSYRGVTHPNLGGTNLGFRVLRDLNQ